VKTCSKCGIEKDESCFNERKNKDGLREQCKDCQFSKKKEWILKHKDEIAEYQAKYRKNNKETIAIGQAKWQQENKEAVSLKKKEWNRNHKEEMAEYQLAYQEEHKEELKKYRANYYQRNKKTIAVKRAEYGANRLKTDQVFRFRTLFSALFRQYLKSNGVAKRSSTYHLIGYSSEEGKAYIEKLFSHPENLTPDKKVWMTWENWGRYNANIWDDNDPATWKWNIDHIIPQSEFRCTAENDEEVKKCWSLNNLRPYSAKQNIIDGPSRVRHNDKKSMKGKK
jgi:hypothetical protein